MSIGLQRRKENAVNTENLRHLFAIAAADGQFALGELRLLGDRALSWGITDDEFEALLDEAARGDAELQLPDNHDDRRALLSDLVRMMAADGELHPKEKDLFAVIASKMEISVAELNQVIDKTIADGSP